MHASLALSVFNHNLKRAHILQDSAIVRFLHWWSASILFGSSTLSRTDRARIILIASAVGVAGGFGFWKHQSLNEAKVAARTRPGVVETVAVALAQECEYQRTTTAIGTILATRSISVRNALAGTVKSASLEPGAIVEAGTVLVALDTSVERAELAALQAQAVLAARQYERTQRMYAQHAVSERDLDNAVAERDVVAAQIDRTNAIIGHKTLRAPFRARVGLSDVHEGQYLPEGTLVTTLQGVARTVFVDFPVAQDAAVNLARGAKIKVRAPESEVPTEATIVAVDSRLDPMSRNVMVRAEISDNTRLARPGASVTVEVPYRAPRNGIYVPASAIRMDPSGDHVFVITSSEDGQPRAHVRRVQVAGAVGDEVFISKGLASGETVAAAGSFKLRESALVSITNPAELVAGNKKASLKSGS
jgi:membrane fusion protein, multidrug efflux system